MFSRNPQSDGVRSVMKELHPTKDMQPGRGSQAGGRQAHTPYAVSLKVFLSLYRCGEMLQ